MNTLTHSHRTIVVSNTVAAKDTYILKLALNEPLLSGFKTGQFAHIRIPGNESLLLRRPFSVYDVNKLNNTLCIAYAVVGKGTRRLTQAVQGDVLDILFPLGNGFSVAPDINKIWLVGGGMGCAPLLSAVNSFSECEFKAFLGFRTKEYIFAQTFAERYDTVISTEDGSYGEKGLITDILKAELHRSVPDMIFACGPEPFFRTLKQTIKGLPIIAQVSLERRMGCGTGGCAVCVCKINGKYKRVCFEGPVFNLSEVDDFG